MNCMNANNSCVVIDGVCNCTWKIATQSFYGSCPEIVVGMSDFKHTFHFYFQGLGNCINTKVYKTSNIYMLCGILGECALYKDNIRVGDKVSDDYKIHSKKNDDNVCINVD